MARAPANRSPSALAQFEPKSRAGWRRWLDRRHGTTPGVWLVYLKGSRRRITYAEAVEEALCFGWIDSVMQPIDGERYRQLFTPRKPKSHWSALNKARVRTLAARGLIAPAGQEVIDRAKRTGTWRALDDVEALTIPPEFARALAADPQARVNFEAFTPSKKKMYLYWINNAKRPQTRARRIEESVALVARNVSGPHLQK